MEVPFQRHTFVCSPHGAYFLEGVLRKFEGSPLYRDLHSGIQRHYSIVLEFLRSFFKHKLLK